jgi:Flp pilus assembly protein CpaB
LLRPTRSTDVRKAAINASTVFAITLAIIAGLIAAWVFKTVFLKPQKVEAKQAEPTYPVTVLAANVPEDTKIASLQIRRIRVSKAKLDEYMTKATSENTSLLTGSQPIGRVTKVPLKAEEPVYENQLVELHYPKPIKLEPGKVAATVEVPAANMSVRQGDRVDLLCTLSNTDPDLGPTETRTAVMAKNVKVVARFNTTAEGARPTAQMARTGTRPYTLEVTNFRYGLIELAKQIGGAFSLMPHSKEETGVATTVSAKGTESEDKDVSVVTSDDLVKLFGFSKPLPPRYFEVEKVSGVDPVQGAHIFLQPGSPQPAQKSSSSSGSSGNRPGSNTGPLQGPNMRPGGSGAPGNGPRPQPPTGRSSTRQASISGTVDSNLSASGWRHVSVQSGPGPSMANNRGPGGMNRPGGGRGLAGPGGTLTASLGGPMGGPTRDCPNCGKKR